MEVLEWILLSSNAAGILRASRTLRVLFEPSSFCPTQACPPPFLPGAWQPIPRGTSGCLGLLAMTTRVKGQTRTIPEMQAAAEKSRVRCVGAHMRGLFLNDGVQLGSPDLLPTRASLLHYCAIRCSQGIHSNVCCSLCGFWDWNSSENELPGLQSGPLQVVHKECIRNYSFQSHPREAWKAPVM